MGGNLAKSGTHQLGLIGETYDAIRCGRCAVGIAQSPLVPASMPCFQVLAQVDRNQQTNVFFGNESDGCYIELIPGQSITIPVNDANKIYVRATVAGQYVNWMVLR